MTASRTAIRRRRVRAVARWWQSVQWWVVAIGAAAAFVLGVVGFRQRFAVIGEARSILDAAYLSLQLFTLESGSAPPPVPAALQAARFLAPAAGVLGAVVAVMSVFGEQLARFRLRFGKEHAVVCGLGERGQRIAEDLLDSGVRVAVIERDEHDPHVDQVREAGASVLVADATDEVALRRVRADRAKHVIAVCADDGTNAEVAVRLSHILAEDPPRKPVTAIVHVYDTELCELLAQGGLVSQGCDGLRLEYFNVPKSGAAAMLTAVRPVSRDPARAPHVVVVGVGKLGRSLVTQMARGWWEQRDRLPGKPRVTLIDRAARAKVELIRVRAPRVGDACELVPLPMEKNAPAFERAAFLYDRDGALAIDAVYVCPDDDVHALAAALTMQRHTREAGVPIAVRMNREGGLASLVSDAGADAFANVRAVGVLDATCTMRVLLSGLHEQIARAVHEDYVRRQRKAGVTIEENPSMADWDDLPEDLRESNRRQADDISEKLRLLGMTVVPIDDWEAEPEPFKTGEVDRLAILEHERWVRERTEAGWRYAPGPKDLDRRTSPHLVPWDDLDPAVQDLDRDAVLAIPGLLARAGLALRRSTC